MTAGSGDGDDNDRKHHLVSESGVNNGDVIIDDSIVKKIDDSSSLADDSVHNSGGAVNNRFFLSSSSFLSKYWVRKQWTQLRIKFPVLQSLEDLFMKIPPRIRRVLLVLWFGKWIFFSFGVFLVTFVQQQQQQQQVPHGTGIGRFAASSAMRGPSTMNRTLLSLSFLDGSTSTSGHSNNIDDSPVKVLYVVTSLAEYNNGKRATIKGSDRFLHLMLPVIMDGIETMVEGKTTTTATTTTATADDGAKSTQIRLNVDFFLITAYELRPERQQLIRDRLRAISEKHNNVIGFDFWDNATPLGYTTDGKRRMNDPNMTRQKLRYNTRALARQHRYVVRDKLEHYDMFVCFEDDMRITKQHVEHFWKSSLEIERLRSVAPKSLSFVEDKDGKRIEEFDDVEHYKKTKFFGKMSKRQLERVVPGFVRVEALTNDTSFYRHIESNDVLDILPIPLDYEFEVSLSPSSDKSQSSSSTTKKQLVHYEIDPSICCHVSVEEQKEIKLPQNPQPEDLVIWETNAVAFSLRQFPEGSSDLLEWSILMLGTLFPCLVL